jgi:ElaB/YqjD/DUF883 family membrane-anchored ribosome-binding protein
MLVSPSTAADKRDLHVGGLGTEPAGALAAVVDPLMDASENWLNSARELANTADDFIRDNPWQAIGVVALVGVTLGFLLARRS